MVMKIVINVIVNRIKFVQLDIMDKEHNTFVKDGLS